jgi:hypothetical protein
MSTSAEKFYVQSTLLICQRKTTYKVYFKLAKFSLNTHNSKKLILENVLATYTSNTTRQRPRVVKLFRRMIFLSDKEETLFCSGANPCKINRPKN